MPPAFSETISRSSSAPELLDLRAHGEGGVADRILDEAEALFAAGGVEALSMRAITRLAGVNLAAVNYHFGSKHRMIVAMVQRRFEPINARRLERLEAAVTLARPGTPALDAVVDAFLEPVLALDAHVPREKAVRTRIFVGRVMFLPPEVVSEVYRAGFEVLAARFHAVLQETLPEVPADELLLRMHLALGPLARVLVCGPRLFPRGQPDISFEENEEIRVRVRDFICAGLRAPSRARA